LFGNLHIKEASNVNEEPIFTTNVPHFTGTIDYIFINNNFEIKQYLEMPYQNNLVYHFWGKQKIESILNLDNNKIENDLELPKLYKQYQEEREHEKKQC